MNAFQSLETYTTNNIKGICVKLSKLEKQNIGLQDVIDTFSQQVIVDAEYQSLDEEFQHTQVLESLSKNEKERIIPTLQMRRTNFENSIEYFSNLKMGFALVPGHKAYFKVQKRVTDQVNLLTTYHELIRYIAVGEKLRDQLSNKHLLRFRDDQILELYGEHYSKNSTLWTFYANRFTEELDDYISRRNNQRTTMEDIRNSYSIYNYGELSNSSNNYLLYVGVSSKEEYLQELSRLSDFVSSS